MPHDGEFAGTKSLKRLVESERVNNLLSRYKIREHKIERENELPLKIAEVTPSDWQPRYILSIDGSSIPQTIQNGFPGAEVGYITVSAVLIDAAKQRELDKKRPVSPFDFNQTQNAGSYDEVLPGSNIVFDDSDSAKDTMRKALFEMLQESKNRLSSEGESLLETYEVLLQYKPQDTAQAQKCPYDSELRCGSTEKKRLYQQHSGTYNCNCIFNRPLYSTDALRIHEGMVPEGTNITMYTETMQVLERLFLINILRWLEKNAADSFRYLTIVVDGPLAVFGHPAWLSQAIRKELKRINDNVKATTGKDIMLIGVEKTGFFVDHFEFIDTNKDGSKGRFPAGSAALLTDSYIKKHIIFSDPSSKGKQYGADTYFGRKLFFKTTSKAKIVAVTPFYEEAHSDLSKAELEQHPRLEDIINFLNQNISARYINALAPLIEAHKEAAIPLHIGSQTLKQLVNKLMKK